MSYATRLRTPSVFRDGALKVMDHARHLAIYLKVVATLREQNVDIRKLQVAWLAYVAAMKSRKDCFFCEQERSAKIAKAALRGAVNEQAARVPRSKKPNPKPAVATEPQTAAEQKQRDEQFATYQSTPAMQGGQVYIQKAD